MKKTLLTCVLAFAPMVSVAAPSVNDMQTCQGLLDFLDGKLAETTQYDASEVAKIRQGLKGYNDYIQTDIVTPGLRQYGDVASLQAQVDQYKATIVNAYKGRYTDKRIYADHAVAVNNCAKKAVPSGAKLEQLKQALELMLKLSKQK